MPITDTDSYPPVMQEFIEHWIDVNAFLGGTAAIDFKLTGGYPLATFTADRVTLDALIIAINSDVEVALAQAIRDTKKEAIRPRMTQFRAIVTGQLAGSAYARVLPTLPRETDTEGHYLEPFHEMERLWSRINADATLPGFTPPLLLPVGYTIANFITELAALRAAYLAVAVPEDNLRFARAQRDPLLSAAFERMKQYRLALPGALPAGNPLLDTVPALTPLPGSTPDAVILTAVWNATTVQANLNWTASTDPALATYQVRACPGPVWDAGNASSQGTYQPAVLAISTTYLLQSPGDQATFKVMVQLSTGNERSSNAVTVSRP